MIAVNWGTSNLRAFRLHPDGVLRDTRSAPLGILHVSGQRFAEALRTHVGDWLAQGETHILLSGMIGSRQGWVEAPHLPCPVGLADLADSLVAVPFPDADVRIVPGVSGSDPRGLPEVMRGEETEIFGIAPTLEPPPLLCLPGTHSKWVRLSDGSITSFFTCMTGEVYAALGTSTILARMMAETPAVDPRAFLRGVARSADPGGLLHHLFSVRTLALKGDLEPQHAAAFLSGLLIGHEVRSSMPPAAHVHLVGAAPLCSLYAQAIHACGGTSTVEPDDAAARGLAAIGRLLKWT